MIVSDGSTDGTDDIVKKYAEIYGDGEGSLKELVYEPTERLIATFQKWNARFVTFVEVAEREMIEADTEPISPAETPNFERLLMKTPSRAI